MKNNNNGIRYLGLALIEKKNEEGMLLERLKQVGFDQWESVRRQIRELETELADTMTEGQSFVIENHDGGYEIRVERGNRGTSWKSVVDEVMNCLSDKAIYSRIYAKIEALVEKYTRYGKKVVTEKVKTMAIA